MKKLVIFILAFLSIKGFGQSVSQLKIEPQVYDFGVIKESDGVAKATFKITNVSSRPYILNYSYSSCGCASTKISKEPLLPGKSRDVVFEFDPKRRPGVFSKEVSLISNNRKTTDYLRVKGEVIPKPKSIEEMYPIKTIRGVMLSEDVLPVGIINQGEKHTVLLNYYNSSKKSVNIDFKVRGSEFASVDFPSTTLEANREGQLQFSYDLRDKTYYGELKSSVEMYVNGEKWQKPIEANSLVVYNFFALTDKEREMAPRAIIAPHSYTVKAVNEKIEIPVENTGRSDLKVLSVVKSSDNIVYSINSKVIKPSEKATITLSLKMLQDENISILFNSPYNPIVTIYLKKE